MTNFTWKDVYVAEEIRNQRLAEAEFERALQFQHADRESGRMAKWMIALGAKIEQWGCRLQSKYQRVLSKQEAAALGSGMIMLRESGSHRNC